MAWIGRAKNNIELINNLKKKGQLSNERVKQIMYKVDRGNYCNSYPYVDSPQSIGYSATISSPHMHASVLELLESKLKPGSKCLDVGSGSGYLTVCMSLMVQPNGEVFGIEHISELVEVATKNIKKDQPGLLESKKLKLIVGDGRKGYQQEAPYDVIHVGAACAKLPQILVDQLKPDGRIIIPIGEEGYNQMLEKIDKNLDGTIKREKLFGVLYIPLTDKNYQYGNFQI